MQKILTFIFIRLQKILMFIFGICGMASQTYIMITTADSWRLFCIQIIRARLTKPIRKNTERRPRSGRKLQKRMLKANVSVWSYEIQEALKTGTPQIRSRRSIAGTVHNEASQQPWKQPHTKASIWGSIRKKLKMLLMAPRKNKSFIV